MSKVPPMAFYCLKQRHKLHPFPSLSFFCIKIGSFSFSLRAPFHLGREKAAQYHSSAGHYWGGGCQLDCPAASENWLKICHPKQSVLTCLFHGWANPEFCYNRCLSPLQWPRKGGHRLLVRSHTVLLQPPK